MNEIEEKWIVRRKVGPRAIKSKIYYSEERALQDAEEHHGEYWIIVEYSFTRYGVESSRKPVYRWYNKLYYQEGRCDE